MATAFPQESELRESQAKIAFNLSLDYSRAAKIDSIVKMYQQLTELCRNYPGHLAICIERARLMRNLIMDFTIAGYMEKAREMYRELAELAASRPDVPDFRIAQADTAVALLAKIDESEEATPDE
jgi:lipopolysaccharide biosynthesis regulator YciM